MARSLLPGSPVPSHIASNLAGGVRAGKRMAVCLLATFWVHNEAAIPEDVRLQIFRRSFSTKSVEGRGIGSYSARLIMERYLGGSLIFRSSEEEGTTFVVTLPAPAAV